MSFVLGSPFCQGAYLVEVEDQVQFTHVVKVLIEHLGGERHTFKSYEFTLK